jgi:drug/metabolite transporter (DMT)-like permease
LIAVLAGIGAALAWSVSSLCSSRSSRRADPPAVVAGMMLVGLLICGPLAAAEGMPARLHGTAWLWLALAGGGNVAGLMVAYAALRRGQVSLVLPLVSTEGAIAALIAVFAGESLSSAAAAALLLATVGVCLASIRPSVGDGRAGAPVARGGTHGEHHFTVVALALCAALLFGGSLYGTARAAALLPSAWVVLAARAIGTVVLALPLMLSGRLRLPRAVLALVVASGLGEVLGFFSYNIGSAHSIAITAVLGSQFSTLGVIGSYLLFGERLGRIQLVGVCTVIVGVSLLSAATA